MSDRNRIGSSESHGRTDGKPDKLVKTLLLKLPWRRKILKQNTFDERSQRFGLIPVPANYDSQLPIEARFQ